MRERTRALRHNRWIVTAAPEVASYLSATRGIGCEQFSKYPLGSRRHGSTQLLGLRAQPSLRDRTRIALEQSIDLKSIFRVQLSRGQPVIQLDELRDQQCGRPSHRNLKGALVTIVKSRDDERPIVIQRGLDPAHVPRGESLLSLQDRSSFALLRTHRLSYQEIDC